MTDEYKIIQCPDCEGKGKKYEIWFNLLFGERKLWTNEDCPRCKGLGSLKIKENDLEDVNKRKEA